MWQDLGLIDGYLVSDGVRGRRLRMAFCPVEGELIAMRS